MGGLDELLGTEGVFCLYYAWEAKPMDENPKKGRYGNIGGKWCVWSGKHYSNGTVAKESLSAMP